MNRDIYRLVKNQLGLWVPAPECSRGHRKGGSKARQALLAAMFPLSLSSLLFSGVAHADGGLPTPCATCGGAAAFAAYGNAAFAKSGNIATVSQVGDKAILNWRDFNVAKGNSVIFQQVSDLLNLQLVNGASFSTLNRIWDADPSVIAGQIRAAQGQHANLMFINQNGIVFANGADIDVNSLTASTLDIKDKFFTGLLTPDGNITPQFENGLDGNPNLGGFVKVLDGAKLSAASGGRVMLIAPTVTNRGTINTPNGQAILAAGNKVFLATSSDPALRGLLVEVDNVNLADGEYDTANTSVPVTVQNPNGSGETINVADGYDKLGNTTNLGTITAAKGNVTMVGLAVNQMNRASASTSLQLNGSIYLMAKSNISADLDSDDSVVVISSTKAGRVILGEGSHTEVLTEVNDTSKSKEAFTHSNVEIVGKNILVKSNAEIKANSGAVNFSAVLDPSQLTLLNKGSTSDPFLNSSNSAFDQTSIRFESGAKVDVSGLDVTTPVSDNYLKIKLLGDEFANSPINRNGVLRGQEVWVDLLKGSPLIANIADYKKNIERTVAFGSTAAGSVSLKSQGDVVVKPNVTFDLSGGSVTYTAAQVNETKLMGADGKVYDMANAPADMRYLGIANQYTKDYGRWGVKEVFNRAQKVYNPGYTEGSNAGTLSLNTRQAYFAGAVDGSTTIGLGQAQTGSLPLTALLQIGAAKVNGSKVVEEYGLNQNLIIGAAPTALAAGFSASTPLSADEQENMHLDSALLGGSGFNRVELYSNKTVKVDSDVNLAAGGSFKATAVNVQFNADVKTQSGSIEANAKSNLFEELADPSSIPNISLADGVTLSTAGGWVNDMAGTANTPISINAGSVKLSTSKVLADANVGDIDLGRGSLIDVRGGAYRSVDGKVTAGKGGDITLSSVGINAPDALQNHFAGESLGSAGTLDVTASAVQIGGTTPVADVLHLDAGYFKQGFANYNLAGLNGVTVADNTQINVKSHSLELLPVAPIKSTATTMSQVTRVVTQTDDMRKPANISLKATNDVNQISTLTIGAGAEINTDIGAKVTLSGTKSVEIEGKVNVPAGAINITLDKSITRDRDLTYDPTERIHLGSQAVLAAAGAAKVFPNTKGLRTGDVLSGGTINITAKTGYVDTEQGALIDVHGAAPVQLDISSLAGGIGQAVAGNAGAVNVTGQHGVFLDNSFNAQAGRADRKGGAVLIQAGFVEESLDDQLSKVAHVGNFANISPSGFQDVSQKGHAYADLSKLEAAGFERMTVRSSDRLILEGDLSVGQTGAPLQSIKLDAPNIESDGGNAALKASIVQLGNTYVTRQANAVAPVTGAGTLVVQADLIELLGKSSFSGFSNLNFSSTGELRLTGVQQANSPKGFGGLDTKASMDITAGIVTPSSLSTFDLSSTDSDIHFRTATNSFLTNPLSVMGNVNVTARNIYQDGRIVAPFGSINLTSTDTVQLGAGSVTSVASAVGSVLPLGITLNGLNWFIDSDLDGLADDAELIKSLPVKTVKLDGKDVKINDGEINIAGGGDIQATEFASGPGGLTDILAQSGYYAILPGYAGIAAPADPQPGSFNLSPGQSVYLAGGNGLKAGNYTLLPAQYALLPGAYAVKLTGGVPDVLPVNAYSKADGTHVIAGFVTDSRFTQNELSTARWTGFEVLNRDEVRQRSEYSLTPASTFFAKDGISAMPADAGLLAIKTVNSLTLNGQLNTTAGVGGKGAAVDISAAKLAIVDGTTAAADEVALDVKALNALNADSLLIGALREKDADTGVTKLNVAAGTVRMDSVSVNGQPVTALKGREVMLAAIDQVSLEHESAIKSEGAGGDAGIYSIDGNAAFVRVAATDAKVQHTGTIDRSTGNITATATSKITSARSVILDATNENSYQGQLVFSSNGLPIAGSLSIGANRINFGNVPGGTPGLVFDNARLASLNGLDEAVLRSYSSFDFYRTLGADGTTVLPTTLGNFADGKYSINNLSLQGGGLRGMGDGSDTVNIQVKTLQISNPDAIGAPDATTGTGSLVLKADKLISGAGEKAIIGFAQTTANATEVIGQGAGKLNVAGALNINTARISGESGANQSLESTGAMLLAQSPLPVNADNNPIPLEISRSIGADWAFKGSSIDFGTLMETHSGKASLTATTGDLTLINTAKLDVSGQQVAFFDQTRSTAAGTLTLTSASGNITADSGATINVSAAAGGDGGQLNVNATQGTADLANATLLGSNAQDAQGNRGQGASINVDAQTVSAFNNLNSQLNTGGFAQSREFRLRSGDLALTQSGPDAIKAHEVLIAVDNGRIDVSGEIDASGNQDTQGRGGNIGLYAKNGITLVNGANLHAQATAAGEKGGKIVVATSGGTLDLQTGSQLNVSDSTGAASGEVLLRAPRTGAGAGNGVAVTAVNSTISGAASTVLEAVKTYTGVTTLTSGTANTSTLGFTTIANDVASFMGNKNTILNNLGKTGDNTFHLRAGAEVQSTGNLVVGATATDWNLYSVARTGNEPGTLTLRATGDLTFNGSLSDGFVTAATTSAIGTGESWSYRLAAGADTGAANPLAVNANATGNFVLAQNKLIRTGTGDIDIAAGGNFELGFKSGSDNQQTGVIYTAGIEAPVLSGFTVPAVAGNNYFTQSGGDISIDVHGDIHGAATNQLYSNWLFRQGKVNTSGNFDASNPQTAWWVRFDQFQQGIGALGGGNVSVKAGGDVENLSVSSATNGRMASTTPQADKLTVLGGGDVTVKSGGDIAGGQFYTGKGVLTLAADGAIKEKRIVNDLPFYTTIALGDAQANISARGDVNLQAVINPTLVPQKLSGGNTNISGSSDTKRSIFSTYTDDTAINLQSLNGNLVFHNDVDSLQAASSNLAWNLNNYQIDVLRIYPGTVKASAYNGDVQIIGAMNLFPAPMGQLELLARHDVQIAGNVNMSDAEKSAISIATQTPTPTTEGFNTLTKNPGLYHALAPVHANDGQPVLVYAVDGDISGPADQNVLIALPKAAHFIAGRDFANLGVIGQNINADDTTSIRTGRDLKFTDDAQALNELKLGGPGRFDFEVGRNLDLGVSKGISTSGDLANTALARDGASIQIAVGVPKGVDYAGAIDRLLVAINDAITQGKPVSDSTLWQARWLVGNEQLGSNGSPSTLLAAVTGVQAQGAEVQREKVRSMFYQALRDTGRDYNNPDSPFAGQYDRGYNTIALLFPGVDEKNADGSSKNYDGQLNLYLTSIKTQRGGDIEYMAPGGGALIGLAQISNKQLPGYVENNGVEDPKVGRKTTDLGIVSLEKGAIRGFTRDDMLVNQSRILTVGGGDILLWSSEGDLDAGKGKRTASTVPPPIIRVDPKTGNIVVELQGAATGSGIGALGDNAGDVDLIAPKGTVNAGDAGVRARNVNIAAQTVLNAGNISASGSATGTQVADAGALGGSIAGASGVGSDVAKNVANDVSKNAAQAANNPFIKPVIPSFIDVEVISIGE